MHDILDFGVKGGIRLTLTNQFKDVERLDVIKGFNRSKRREFLIDFALRI